MEAGWLEVWTDSGVAGDSTSSFMCISSIRHRKIPREIPTSCTRRAGGVRGMVVAMEEVVVEVWVEVWVVGGGVVGAITPAVRVRRGMDMGLGGP